MIEARKACSNCLEPKPVSLFYRRGDGHKSWCIACEAISAAGRYKSKRPVYLDKRRAYNKANRGRLVAKNRERLKDQTKLSRTKENQRLWRERNAGHIAAMREIKIEEIRANNMAWHVANREHIRAKAREWRLKNPERCRRYALDIAKRRRSIINRTPEWANRFFITEIYSLARLRSRLTGMQWEVDHIIPLQHPLVCGLHVESNLRVIPAVLNKAKGNEFKVGA